MIVGTPLTSVHAVCSKVISKMPDVAPVKAWKLSKMQSKWFEPPAPLLLTMTTAEPVEPGVPWRPLSFKDVNR
jgi:hypothetical protein